MKPTLAWLILALAFIALTILHHHPVVYEAHGQLVCADGFRDCDTDPGCYVIVTLSRGGKMPHTEVQEVRIPFLIRSLQGYGLVDVRYHLKWIDSQH